MKKKLVQNHFDLAQRYRAMARAYFLRHIANNTKATSEQWNVYNSLEEQAVEHERKAQFTAHFFLKLL